VTRIQQSASAQRELLLLRESERCVHVVCLELCTVRPIPPPPTGLTSYLALLHLSARRVLS